VSLPFYVEDVLRVSVDWYGYLLEAMGIGAVIGGAVAGRFPSPGVVGRGTIQLVCTVVTSSCLLPLPLVRSPWAAAE
jgi:predicted MFS family arabinose efflux permease